MSRGKDGHNASELDVSALKQICFFFVKPAALYCYTMLHCHTQTVLWNMHMPPLLHWRWCRLQRDHSSQARFLIVKRSAVHEILSKRWSLCWAKVNWSCHCCSLLVQKCLAYIFWVGKCWHEWPILHVRQGIYTQNLESNDSSVLVLSNWCDSSYQICISMPTLPLV